MRTTFSGRRDPGLAPKLRLGTVLATPLALGQGHRDEAGDAGVVFDQGGVGPNRGAMGELGDPGQEPGRRRRAVDTGRLGAGQRLFDRLASLGRRKLA